MQNHTQFIRIWILFTCCLANFIQKFCSSELQIHFKIIKIFSVEAEMLLWFLKDQRVYLHNVLFLACFNWEFFQGVKIHDTMSLNQLYKIAFVIFRHLIARGPLPQYRSVTWAYGTFSSSWSLWRNLVHDRTRVVHVCFFPRTLDDCWTEPRRTLVRNKAPHSDLGLNQCLLVVKAHLKPAYN